MKAKVRPAMIAGIIGALMLLMVILIFGFSWAMLPRDQLCFLSWIFVPGFVFSFILSGALSSYFAPQEESNKAFKRGIIAGCITALVPLALWILGMALLLYYRMIWNDGVLMVVMLVMITIARVIGVVISAFSSMFYVFLTRHVTVTTK